jgi:hypothetical protein
MKTMPLASTVSTMRRQASADTPSGFSHSTASPRAAARATSSGCFDVSLQIATALQSSSSASRSPRKGVAKRDAASRPRAASSSHTPARTLRSANTSLQKLA